MLNRLQKLIRILSKTFEWLSIVAGWTMTAIVFSDAFSHKLFRHSLKGSYDSVSYLFIPAITFALSSSLINGKLIKFDLFVIKSPKHLQELLNSLVALFSMVLSILIIWQSLLYGRTLQAGAEISPTAKFPIYPFAYGIAISFLPIFLELLSQFINSIKQIFLKLPIRAL